MQCAHPHQAAAAVAVSAATGCSSTSTQSTTSARHGSTSLYGHANDPLLYCACQSLQTETLHQQTCNYIVYTVHSIVLFVYISLLFFPISIVCNSPALSAASLINWLMNKQKFSLSSTLNVMTAKSLQVYKSTTIAGLYGTSSEIVRVSFT